MKKTNIDSPFYRTMGKIGDLLFANLLWLVCCLPIVTAGASTLGLFTVVNKEWQKLPEELKPIMDTIKTKFTISRDVMGIGSTIFAVKPGDGSAREQAASCQKVLGGWANIAREYATKRYRSNLINWGMLPFIFDEENLPFENGDYVFIPQVAQGIKDKKSEFTAYVVRNGEMKEFTLKMGELTDDEREIILAGCLINYNRNKNKNK